MDNEPNEREKEIANDPKRICLMESATGVREQIARALANYRAELCPEPTAGDAKKPLTARALLNSGLVGIWKGREPTAGDQEAARKIFDEIHCKYLGCLDADFGVTEASEQAELVIAAALSAARGNAEARVKALEDAAQKAVTEACEFCRYGKKELPGRRDYCKSEHCQWLKIINALAEKG